MKFLAREMWAFGLLFFLVMLTQVELIWQLHEGAVITKLLCVGAENRARVDFHYNRMLKDSELRFRAATEPSSPLWRERSERADLYEQRAEESFRLAQTFCGAGGK